MKYGLLMHSTTKNLGDDIQSYAIAQFLPQIDYMITRETMDEFQSEENEPVAVIMSAWWMWEKWHWPPAECIYPMMVSMHLNNYDIYQNGTPVYNEWLQGIGGDYMRAYGPVGCRDQSSMDYLTEIGIDNYFSGCITLTLPKQKETADKGTYICLVDIDAELEKKVREWLSDCPLEIRTLTQRCNYRDSEATLEERFAVVEEYLSQYQNAAFVITRRLHVTLPCLAMETPVFSIVNIENPKNETRWIPYTNWVNFSSRNDFLAGKCTLTWQDIKENKKDYYPVREKLMEDINRFIEQAKTLDGKGSSEIKKTTYESEEVLLWQNNLMKWTLHKWLFQNRELLSDRKAKAKQIKELKKKNQQLKEEMQSMESKVNKENKDKKYKKDIYFKDWWNAFKARRKK